MTHHKRSALQSVLLALLASAVVSVNAYGFAEFERGAVTLETEGRLTYDSYFIGAKKIGDDDYYASLSPKLKYSRKAGLAEISAFAGVNVIRYDTYKEFDSEDFNAGFHSQLPVSEGSRISGDVDVGYSESTVIDYSVLDRIPTKSLNGGIHLRYQMGLKTSLADSATYSKSTRSAYSDQTTYGNDLSFSYSDFLNGTSLSLSHGYVRTTSSGENVLNADLDQTSNSLSATLSRPIVGKLIGDATFGYRILHRSRLESDIGQTRSAGSFFSLGLTGPFLSPYRFPKLESSMSVTYQESRSPGINDLGQKTLTGNMRLSWAARERTKLGISANRSVDLAPNDLSVETTQAAFTVSESVGFSTHLDGSLGYSWRKFRGVSRDDNTFDGSLSATHQLNKYWSTGASYTYQKNNSSSSEAPAILARYQIRSFNYERHVISVFVTNIF